MTEKGRKIAKRSSTTAGILTAALVGVYWYQPQRIDFFPRPAPDPNPAVDPDSKELFSSEARVAVVVAHPDDPEFFIGGTLTKLSHAGAKIAIVMCTDGDKGYYPSFLTDAAENRRVRQQEQIEAARQYGAEVFFLHKPDGRLRANAETVLQVGDALRRFDANYVLTFDPEYPPRLQHSDHLQSGVAATDAIRLAPNVRWLLRFSTYAANYTVDISKEWPTKSDLLAIHKSQFYGRRLEMIRRMVGGRARTDGRRIGAMYGEGYRCSHV